jgi:NADPH-dependent glutamate synthase beta subunit-like oxidoreductase
VTSVQQLKSRGFDAIFLALGAHASWKLGVPGEDEAGVLDCVAFLRRVSLGSALRFSGPSWKPPLNVLARLGTGTLEMRR